MSVVDDDEISILLIYDCLSFVFHPPSSQKSQSDFFYADDTQTVVVVVMKILDDAQELFVMQ